jgi:hypothetical protein
MSGPPPTLVLPPEAGFAELREKLEGAGWHLGAESQEAPLIAGEPTWCEWWHDVGGAEIFYAFNPVVRLRVMEFSGEHAAVARAAVGEVVPQLGEARVRELIDAGGDGEDDERQVLLGLLAARAMRAIGVADRVKARLDDPRPRVRSAAVEAAEAIVPPVLERAAHAIGEAVRARPGHAVGFAQAGPPSHKRQILRWLAEDFEGSSDAIDLVLRTALVDEDAEVRVTAVVVAARLGAVRVVPALIAADLPEDTGRGADPRERRLYHLLRQVAVEYLNEVARGGPSGDRTSWPPKVRGLLGELPVTDDLTLLVHALATPVMRDEAEPVVAGVTRDGVRWKVTTTGAALARIEAVPHWLGLGGEPRQPPNPLRRVTPPSTFVTARPWREEGAADDWRGTLAEAEALAAQLGELWGARVRVPTADEWEMALRGPDGRVYPWGNNLAPTTRGLSSPWGAAPPAASEWALDGARALIVGDVKVQPCAFRRAPTPDERAGVRFVVG